MAHKEVILSAGAIASPQLLQVSGIGPKSVLEAAGVPVLHELAGVGENLQDHLEVYFQYRCKQPISLNSKLDYFNMGLIGARWILFKSGLGATNHFESCGFIRSRAGLQWPNIQYHFLPAAMRYDGQAAFSGHGYQVHVGPNKPSSRGHVHIHSADMAEAPEIVFNYLTHEQDRQDWRDTIRLTREILNQPAFDIFKEDEIQPGFDVENDEQIDAWIRANVESAYHPSCTCKMGADNDPLAVLDSQCRVRGIQGLRVVDASVFPTITNGNLNAPTMMVAEKAADMILEKAPLVPLNVDVWQDQQWQDQQRPGKPLR
jgi:choline dehydrogenase